MSDLDSANLVKLLGVRLPMRDFSLFVGREIELSILDGVAQFPHNCAWIHGAPKNGKSSLALNVAERAKALGKRVKHVNCAEVPPTDFQGLLRRVVFGERSRGGPADIAEKSFAALAATSDSEPLLLIFDNFDGHAINFELAQQYFLRSTKETYSNLSYLFVTRLDPNRVMEDVADEGSRLLAICNQVQVPILAAHEVKQLCRQVAESLGLDCYREWSTQILSKIGGNPAAVVEALANIVTPLTTYQRNPRPPGEIEIAESTARETLRSHWRGLPSASRLFLLGAEEGGEQRASAVREGYWDERRAEPIRPSFLIAVGQGLGVQSFEAATQYYSSAPSALPPMIELHQLVVLINLVANRSGADDIFHMTTEALNYSAIARAIRSEEGLHLAVEHLAKFLYEGARRRRPGANETESEWRITDVTLARSYKNSTGMKMLIFLRQYFDHSPHKPAAAVPREKEVGDWFERACGARVPTTPEQFDRIMGFLLGELINSLRDLHQGLEANPIAELGGDALA